MMAALLKFVDDAGGLVELSIAELGKQSSNRYVTLDWSASGDTLVLRALDETELARYMASQVGR